MYVPRDIVISTLKVDDCCVGCGVGGGTVGVAVGVAVGAVVGGAVGAVCVCVWNVMRLMR